MSGGQPAPNPTFSVVLPTHDRAALLPRAVQSVLRQTLTDFELLIVDDGSQDATPEVTATFDDPRIRILRRDVPGGAAAARNHGIRHARGELVAFLDDDDEYLPALLEETHEVFAAAPKTGFTWCGARVVEDGAEGERVTLEAIWQPSFRSRAEAHRAFLINRKVGTSGGLVVRRRCLEKVGLFDEAYRRGEDTDLLVRLSSDFDFAVVPQILIKIHLHRGPRLTVQGKEMAEAYERLIAKNMEALEADPEAWFELHYKAAWLYYHGGERRRARALARHTFRHGWLRPRAWLVFALFELLGSRAASIHRLASRCRDRLAGWMSPSSS